MYYEINETAARRAKEANSYNSYRAGSATSEYQQMVDKATQLAERQKRRVDPIHHDKIDRLLAIYCSKLAANMNKSFEIDARVPSIMIAGLSNFPIRKKEKQNAARDKNMREWSDIQGLLDKIRGVGMGGISSDDPDALDKLRKKLAGMESGHQMMKDVNAHYRKHKTLDGFDGVSDDIKQKILASMSCSWRGENAVPFESWALSNNNANMKRVRERIASLEKRQNTHVDGWTFPGGEVVINTEINRLQIIYDTKPDEGTRRELKSNGFRWSPKQVAWQRQFTANAERAARTVTGMSR